MTPLPSDLQATDPQFISALNKRLAELETEIETLRKTRVVTAAADAGTPGIATTHALRLANFPAARVEVGTFCFESDRESLYQVQEAGAGRIWRYISGLMQGATAAKPADLGTNDEGFRFYDTTVKRTQEWDGSAWQWYRSPDPPDAAGAIRATGIAQTGEHTGPGLELGFNPTIPGGTILSYDRTGVAWLALRLNGAPLCINASSGGNVVVGSNSEDGSGAKVQVVGAMNCTGGVKVNGVQVVGPQGGIVADVSYTPNATPVTYDLGRDALLGNLLSTLNTFMSRFRASTGNGSIAG